MWPDVKVQEGTIEGMDFVIRQKNEEECKNPNTVIKEIVMIYADYNHVSYNKDEVPLAVQYDTEFGMHVILFSKVKNLKYENRGIPWTATFTSDENGTESSTKLMDDGEYVPEDKLTQMFFKMLKKAINEPSIEEREELKIIMDEVEELMKRPCKCSLKTSI